MRKSILLAVFLVALFTAANLYAQQTEGAVQTAQQSEVHGQGDWCCPWCGRSCEVGPQKDAGMKHRYGSTDWGNVAPFSGRSSARSRTQAPLNEQQARVSVQHYLDMMGNPNLAIGEIAENGNYFEISVVTKEGSQVNTIFVDRSTGWIKSKY